MITKELIEKLVELDPSGELSVFYLNTEWYENVGISSPKLCYGEDWDDNDAPDWYKLPRKFVQI